MPPPRSPIAGRPPLAVSPRRLRSRRAAAHPITTSTQTPPATARSAKSQVFPTRSSVSKEPSPLLPISPEDNRVSAELLAIAKRVEEAVGGFEFPYSLLDGNATPLFERGRLYEAYSARRNERLRKRKNAEMMITEEIVAQDPGVAVELAKRRVAKKVECVRKSVPVNFSVGRASSMRSSLRSSREMKKSSAAAAGGGLDIKPVGDGTKRMLTRSALRKP